MDALKTLIVDDEPAMRAGVERVLKHFTVRSPEVEAEVGLEIRLASTGEEAVRAIRSDRPELLLLDLKLPDMNGLEILTAHAGAQSGILTVVITAYASIETAVTATRGGAYDFLAKPFTPDELRATVGKAAGHILLQREARRHAEEKRQLRFHFISVLAHELKSPLAAIDGYLHIMRDRTLGSDVGTYGQVIDRSLVRLDGMRKLIFDLLDLTRIESGQTQRNLEPLDLAAMAREAAENFHAEAAARRISVSVHAPAPVRITGDRHELEIIINNLLSNAIKYNREGGSVAVSATEDGEQAVLTVADTGVGMTPEESGRLFEDFVRIKNAKTRDIQGSGLGLSTVRKIARLYGGDATVTSVPDEGSTFTVTLRRHQE